MQCRRVVSLTVVNCCRYINVLIMSNSGLALSTSAICLTLNQTNDLDNNVVLLRPVSVNKPCCSRLKLPFFIVFNYSTGL